MTATITREQLLKIAEDCLAISHVKPGSALYGEVMEAARTIERVTGHWWVPWEGCGCLIGTMRHRKGLEPDGARGLTPERMVGLDFLGELMRTLGDDYSDALTPITVVD